MPNKNTVIAVVLAVVVVILFIMLGFFGLKGVGAGPAPLTGPQALLEELAANGGVSELRIYEIAPGTGEDAEAGDTIFVRYIGVLPDGTVFDSTDAHGGEPFSFTLGASNVIQGWHQGLMGVQKGQRLLLPIPPELGYGAGGQGPIPPNSTLIFDIEVVDIVPGIAQ